MKFLELNVYEDCIVHQDVKRVYINPANIIYIKPFFSSEQQLNSEIRIVEGITFYSDWTPKQLLRLIAGKDLK